MARKGQDRIDVNTAGRDELAVVPGIGPSTADAVIKHRKKHGRFANVAALEQVPGVGAQSLESMREHLSASGGGKGGAAEKSVDQGARAAKKSIETGADAGERTAGAGAEAAKSGAAAAHTVADASAEATQRAGARPAEAAGTARRSVEQGAAVAAGHGRQHVQEVATTSHTMLETMREANAAWLDFVQDQTWANLQTAGKLARCRSPRDVMDVQAEYVRGSIERLVDEQGRFARLASRMAAGVFRPLESQVRRDLEAVRRRV